MNQLTPIFGLLLLLWIPECGSDTAEHDHRTVPFTWANGTKPDSIVLCDTLEVRPGGEHKPVPEFLDPIVDEPDMKK